MGTFDEELLATRDLFGTFDKLIEDNKMKVHVPEELKFLLGKGTLASVLITALVATFVVDGLAPTIPILGQIWAFFPPEVKDAVRDEMADAAIGHSNVILDNTHGNTFRAAPAVEVIYATTRDKNHPIKILCYRYVYL